MQDHTEIQNCMQSNSPNQSCWEVLARSYLKAEFPGTNQDLECRLTTEVAAVYHFVVDGVGGGWIISGRLPFQWFSDQEIANPIEAIVVLAWFLRVWRHKRGVDEPKGSLPQFKLAPDWTPMAFEGYDLSLESATGFLAYTVAGHNTHLITHPILRNRAIAMGIISGQPLNPDLL